MCVSVRCDEIGLNNILGFVNPIFVKLDLSAVEYGCILVHCVQCASEYFLLPIDLKSLRLATKIDCQCCSSPCLFLD